MKKTVPESIPHTQKGEGPCQDLNLVPLYVREKSINTSQRIVHCKYLTNTLKFRLQVQCSYCTNVAFLLIFLSQRIYKTWL